MGRQIEFYMTSVDEREFVTSLKVAGDVIVVLNYFSTPELVELDATSLSATVNRNGFGKLTLINRDINPKVSIMPAGPGRYTIEESESEVIEFVRWTIIRGDEKVEPGRLWYDHEDKNCKPKRKAFLTWAQSVFRYIKRKYYRSEEHYGRYFGLDAIEQFKNGTITLAPY